MDWLFILAVLLAFLIKGLCGFANTLVFNTILSFRNSNASITPLELLVGYPSNMVLAWKERKSVSAKIVIPLTLFVIAGSIPGALFLKNSDTGVIKIIFGVVVVLLGVEMLLREKQEKKGKKSPVVLAVVGILSGILCGLFGVGALLAAYVNRTTENTSEFKGNLCAVFIFENTFRLVLYAMTDLLTWQTVKNAVCLLPVMLIGLFLGMELGKILNEKMVKKLVILMLMLSGISLVVTNLRFIL